MIEPGNLKEIFTALDRQIEVHGGSPIGLVVCGGTALAALGLVNRTTKDVDVMGSVEEIGGRLIIHKIDALPTWLGEAAEPTGPDIFQALCCN